MFSVVLWTQSMKVLPPSCRMNGRQSLFSSFISLMCIFFCEILLHWGPQKLTAEGATIDTLKEPRRVGCPPPQPTRRSGEASLAPQRGPGQIPGRQCIFGIFDAHRTWPYMTWGPNKATAAIIESCSIAITQLCIVGFRRNLVDWCIVGSRRSPIKTGTKSTN